MKRRLVVFVFACISATVIYVLFGELPSFLRQTTPIYIQPDPGAIVSIGAPVYKFGARIGYVHKVELTEDDGPSIELRIFEGVRLHKSDVCVIHRLHRYDEATLHIERSLESPLDGESLGDPPVLRCMIANGPWPKLPGLLEQAEN